MLAETVGPRSSPSSCDYSATGRLGRHQEWCIVKTGNSCFYVFITLDSNLAHQQNLNGVDLCVITLHAVNSRYETLQPLVQDILDAITASRPGTIVHLGD
jgi:hypothetical protein